MNKSTNSQPKIKLNTNKIDLVFELLASISIVLLFASPIYFFSILPDSTTSHFNIFGEADSTANKAIIWLLPTIGTILYVGLLVIQKIPHHFSYIIEITQENAKRQYKLAVRLLQILKLIITSVLAYVLFAGIKTAFGEWSGLGAFFLPLFMLMIFATMIIYLVLSYKQK